MTLKSDDNKIQRAVAWLMFGVTGGLGLDLCAKELLSTYPLSQFVFARSFFGLALFLLLAPRFFGGFASLKTRRWKWHALRTVLAIVAMFGFFYGLARMPLVNALTLGFTAPLMVTALSVPLLGESVGWRRWLAVGGGFTGLLIMLRPGTGEFNLASIAVLIAAFCYACQALTARHLGNSETMLAMSVYVVLGPLLVALLPMGDGPWLMPDLKGWSLLFGAGACSVVTWIGFLNGYRSVAPAILAPLEYSALVGGAIAGYLIWDEVPDRWVVFGATIIVISGIFIVHREIRAAANDPVPFSS